jgi:ubiquinone biosynthesis protein COQ4
VLKNASEEVQVFADRTRDLHDLYHVLAGYGRDEFGEICVLAFSYPQQRLRSFAVIALFGALNFASLLNKHKIGAQGVFAAVAQAYRNGQKSTWLPGEDIEALLTEDIENLRRRLNIATPTKYNELISRIRTKTSWRSGPIFHGKRLTAV